MEKQKYDVKNEHTKIELTLHNAIVRGFNKEVELFFKNNVDINKIDEKGNTPLHYAFEVENKEIVDKLLVCGAKVNVKNVHGQTPLHLASEKGAEESVMKLLNKSAELDAEDKDKNTPLEYAVEGRNTNIIKLLLDNGAQLNHTNKFDQTPLHIAAQNWNNEWVIKLLLEEGAKANVKNTEGDTPLHLAIKKYNSEAFQQLVNKGADLEARNNNDETPLILAMKYRFQSAFSLLVRKGVDVNIQEKHEDCYPLHFATVADDCEAIELILDKGVEIGGKNKEGETALHIAVVDSFQITEAVDILLQRGADPNAADNNGQTPVHLILSKFFLIEFNISHIMSLLNWGGSLTVMDKNGSKPLDLFKGDSYAHSQLLFHLIKLICYKANPFKNKLNLSHNMFKEHKSILCLQELKKMKARKCSDNSLYDIFYKCNDPNILLNDDIEHAIKSQQLDTEFPIYASLFRAKFIRCKQRLNIFYMIQNDIKITLPEEIVRMILSYD